MASSDSVPVFLKSSLDLDLDFCVMVSSDDDVSSLKKKAEAEHLLSFPEKGRIVAQAIKIMQEGVMYHVSNSMPIACLIDGAAGTCSLFMDAVSLPPNPAETHVLDLDQHESSMPGSKILSQGTASVLPREEEAEDKLVQGERRISSEKNSQGEFAGFLVHNPGDTSGVRYPIEGSPNQGGNRSCTSQAPERRSLQGSESKDSVVEEVTRGVGIFGEYVEDKGKQKNSKYPSSDEAPSSSKRGSPKSGDKMRDSGCASENKTVAVHHKRGSSLLGNSDLQREGMPGCKARSLEHFTEQFAFGPSDKGKAKLDQSDSNSRTRSPNRKTLKMQQHGVTIREPGPDSREIIRVESLGGEERDRGLSCGKCCSIEESGLENKELEDQIARINQIESDELLARLLQEDINQELKTSDEEMLMDHSMGHFPCQAPAVQIPRRTTEMRFSGPEMEYEMFLLAQLRQEFSSSQINNAKKFELLKELEATYESRSYMDISDFYQDLYYDEDDNVVTIDQTVGATESQINSLPLFTIKEDDVKDACLICLETPCIGSIMQHLPCLHKFHKECIHKWLLIKASCPLCKLAIID